ncbi:hypothetical protein [Halorarius halobius]|uniref:hypothetical protein n=1 Tax=Halorarius halobius TaxID=2962671 RepID=UPI0020CECD86|nr:hypothetical protein [Halorarius halobius]
MAANAYLEHYFHDLPLSLERNLDTILPVNVRRRDYIAKLNIGLSKWAPDGWMGDREKLGRLGQAEMKLYLSDARVDPEPGSTPPLKTQGRTNGPAQDMNSWDMEECDVLIAAQGDEALAEEYREVLGIPVFILENVDGVMPFDRFRRYLGC